MKLGTLKPRVAMLDPLARIKSVAGERPRGSQRIRGKAGQDQRARVLLRDRFICAACGRVHLPDELELDHRVPLSQGGSNGDANCQLLCKPCHAAKTRRERAERGSASAPLR